MRLMREFYKKYYWSIKKFITKKIDDQGIVEELSNDVIWAAWESRDKFLNNSNEFSWICGIAKHKIVDYYRKKKIKTILFSVSPVFEEIADNALTPEKDCLKNELVAEVRRVLKDIKKDYKKILRLKYLKGMAIKEIAKMLGSSEKSIESKLGRARLNFREVWSYDRKKNKENI